MSASPIIKHFGVKTADDFDKVVTGVSIDIKSIYSTEAIQRHDIEQVAD